MLTDREEFEAAWNKEYPLHSKSAFTRSGFDPARYATTRVQDGWLMWQAARATADRDSADAWQPIETAPKDGSMFLGWVNAVRYGESDEGAHFEMDVSETDFCRWQSSETDGYFEGLSGPIGDAEHVTHWMSLPAAPDAAIESQSGNGES